MWTNDGLVYWRIHASLDLTELAYACERVNVYIIVDVYDLYPQKW